MNPHDGCNTRSHCTKHFSKEIKLLHGKIQLFASVTHQFQGARCVACGIGFSVKRFHFIAVHFRGFSLESPINRIVEYTHHQFHHVNCDTLMPVYSLYLSASSFVSSRVSGLHFLVFSLCLSAFVDSRLDRLTCFRGGDIIQARNCY